MKTRPSVRIQCRSRADAKELALRLEADGYRAALHWKAVIVRKIHAISSHRRLTRHRAPYPVARFG